MAFERLQALGEDKFKVILNQLVRGESALGLARHIQGAPPTGWGEFQDTAEKTLTYQLNRLRLVIAEGFFGPEKAKEIAAGHTPQLKLLEGVSVSVIDRLEKLSSLQQARVLLMVEKEEAGFHSSKIVQATNEVTKEYRQLLLDIQKIRFDLGLDEYKGPMLHTAHIKGATSTVTMPDGTSIQQQVYEGITAMDQLFNERQIPHRRE